MGGVLISGTCLAFYPCGSLDDRSKRALDLARPSWAMVHQGPDGLHQGAPAMVSQIRARVMGIRILIGVGWDLWVKRAVLGECTADLAVEKILEATDVAGAVGALGIVEDVEGEAEGHAAHPIGREIAVEVLEQTRTRHPTLLIGHTAYDCPCQVSYSGPSGQVHYFGGHEDYPWLELCGPDGADFDLPEIYWAAPSGQTAPNGAGAWRLARHRDSWELAMQKGLISRSAEHACYVQAHGQTVEDTVAVADQFAFRAFWAAQGDETLDANGQTALVALCKLERLGLDIRAFQARAGLVVDGLCGPKTLGALGVK